MIRRRQKEPQLAAEPVLETLKEPAATSKPAASALSAKPPRQAPPAAVPQDSISVVGRAMVIEGQVEAAEDLIIAGRVQGSLHLPDHTLTVAADGVLEADVHARSVIVEGTVNGSIDCSDLVMLKASARVQGDIKMRRVNISDGASVNGKITMLAPEG